MMKNIFDVIVVGAGPAGSIAALKMARAGLKVALLERGQRPGSKNIFGGLLHNTPVLNKLLPEFRMEAPLERHVYKKTLAFMTPDSTLNLTFETEHFENTPHNGYTVMRPAFDNWLAQQAVKAGAVLLCNCAAENLIKKGNQITGVTVQGRAGELYARVIIAADGVLSFLAENAGLRQALRPEHLGLGIKLLLALPEDTINERFGLVRDEGADFALLGITGGICGGGFLYTNLESLSVGLVVHLDSLKDSRMTPYDLLNQALQHPHLKKLLKGAVPLEYSAHLIPEGGFQGLRELYTDGLLLAGDAAGFCYTNGINLEGINLAMTSGYIAAECAIEALQSGDFSSRKLATYRQKLEESFVFKDMKTFSNAAGMMKIDRLYDTYPELVCRIMEKMFRVDGQPRDKILKLIRKEARGKLSTRQLLSDGFKIGRALL